MAVRTGCVSFREQAPGASLAWLACLLLVVVACSAGSATSAGSAPHPRSVDASQDASQEGTGRGRASADGGAPPQRHSDAGLEPRANIAVESADFEAEQEPAVEGVKLPPWDDMPALCQRPGDDEVRDIFCHPEGQTVAGFEDLYSRLNKGWDPNESASTFAVALGLSTALSGRVVSPINPRLILLSDVFVAFQRGVQLVEIAARDRKTQRLIFYLLEFKQDCNEREEGCLPGDLYTPAVETNWRNITLRDDEDLKNSPADCRQCHQRSLDEPILLMRELEPPWTHFFAPDDQAGLLYTGKGDLGLIAVDYQKAKGDERLAGIPTAALTKQSAGIFLEVLVSPRQPLVFDSALILEERFPTGMELEPVRSETWDRAFEAFQRGEQLALPHYDARPLDPDKLARLTAAYAAYRAGELPAEELPDLADIFPDDPAVRAEIGLETVPNATPAQVLIQACGSCHNDVLDQSLSRARFNIDLARLPRDELELAILRLSLPGDAPGVMPPPEARQLRAPVKAALIEYLQQTDWSGDDLELLQTAARRGMAGGARSAQVSDDLGGVSTDRQPAAGNP